MNKEETTKKKLVPKQLIVYGYGDNFPSTFDWSELDEPWGWSIHVDIRFNMRGEVKTKFTVSPPLPLPNKKRKKLIFKTESYVELKKWLKKNKGLIKNIKI